jgi:hypothetical protein
MGGRDEFLTRYFQILIVATRARLGVDMAVTSIAMLYTYYLTIGTEKYFCVCQETEPARAAIFSPFFAL